MRRALAGVTGWVLYGAAKLIGARVTSWGRTKERNQEVGGSPTSYHLVRGAIDLGKETAGVRLAVLQALADKGGLHSKGTAPHYHFEAGYKTAAVAIALFLLVRSVLNG